MVNDATLLLGLDRVTIMKVVAAGDGQQRAGAADPRTLPAGDFDF
ncbi:hypothetical protein [Nonomuraea sp. NPDC002799]